MTDYVYRVDLSDGRSFTFDDKGEAYKFADDYRSFSPCIVRTKQKPVKPLFTSKDADTISAVFSDDIDVIKTALYNAVISLQHNLGLKLQISHEQENLDKDNIWHLYFTITYPDGIAIEFAAELNKDGLIDVPDGLIKVKYDWAAEWEKITKSGTSKEQANMLRMAWWLYHFGKTYRHLEAK